MHFTNVFYCFVFSFCFLTKCVLSQGPYYPNHWYGANQGNIRSGVVPDYNPVPNVQGGTLAPHICGFNTFTRKCMDPEGYCPGRCMNFRYTYNTLYDCRCLVIK